MNEFSLFSFFSSSSPLKRVRNGASIRKEGVEVKDVISKDRVGPIRPSTRGYKAWPGYSTVWSITDDVANFHWFNIRWLLTWPINWWRVGTGGGRESKSLVGMASNQRKESPAHDFPTRDSLQFSLSPVM